jgi:hypothetical protein
LSHRPRKRFGQKCCPEGFFCVFYGVRKLGIAAVDDFGDSQIMAAETMFAF